MNTTNKLIRDIDLDGRGGNLSKSTTSMQWVKASERMPTEEKQYVLKSKSHSDMWVRYVVPQAIDSDQWICDETEWLEEKEVPVTQGEVENIQLLIVKHCGYFDVPNDENITVSFPGLIDAFIEYGNKNIPVTTDAARPKISHYFNKGANVAEVICTYYDHPALMGYINALDAYCDKLESIPSNKVEETGVKTK